MTARDELAAVLAEHPDATDRSAHDGCWCGDPREYTLHVADALLASPALARVIREAKAEAWDEGAFAGLENQKEVLRIAHWSHIGRSEPRLHVNPYRKAGT